jgi:hypothetical protein
MERIQDEFFAGVTDALKEGQLPEWFESKVSIDDQNQADP